MGILAEEGDCFGRWPIDRQTEFEMLPGDGATYPAWDIEDELVIEDTIHSFAGAKFKVWRLWREGYNYNEISEELGITWFEVKDCVKSGRREITLALKSNGR